MQALQKGKAPVVARARLMVLLGDQLITDEVAAISELVKNAYDANASRVDVTLSNVSEADGYIVVKDNGHGMTREKLLSSWLELGTLSKSRGVNLKPRLTEENKRVCLGEKGLGRLAVHKLGYVTDLVTRREGTEVETKLILDWTAFEGSQGFLGDVPVEWEEMVPQVFTEKEFPNGTQIMIRRLRRVWTAPMLERLQISLLAMKSPFAGLSDFDINVELKDKLEPPIPHIDILDLAERATYSFVGNIDPKGTIAYRYKFQRPDFPQLTRVKNGKRDIRQPDDSAKDLEIRCGPFEVRFYCWDLSLSDQKAVFGDTEVYKEIIRPNTGVRVFRDGFRVLPYGNADNDWLSMDLERVRRFEESISRNQVIGVIQISSESNSHLQDKSDREGLIDNDAFGDFYNLVKAGLTEFQAERQVDRRTLKELTGKARQEDKYRAVFTRNMAQLSKAITDSRNVDTDLKQEVKNLIGEARDSFNELLSEREQPLLVAASFGLTYMMPTHEVRRSIQEAMKLLRRVRESKDAKSDNIDSAILLLKQADSTVGGIGRLMQRTREDEEFALQKPAKEAATLLRFRFERNKVECRVEVRNDVQVVGSERLIEILLLNLLDNSIYWVLRKKESERKIKIIVATDDERGLLAVSDSGPGFGDDDIDTVTLPFFTRKPNGMGLGLYIADRIARMNGARLRMIDEKTLPELLSGASIAVVFPARRK
jgi:signal transduction histidine kinase